MQTFDYLIGEGKYISVKIEGKPDSFIVYLSQAEFEMVQDFRREQETMKVEQTSISSTEQAVRDIQRLREYCENNGISFTDDPVDNIIRCVEHRLMLLKPYFNKKSDLNNYQENAANTAIYPGKGTALGLIYCALKLSGEAGEVAENVGKALRDDGLIGQIKKDEPELLSMDDLTKERANKLKLELGDVLWYVSQAAKELGCTLEEIAQANLDKLAARKDKGTLKGSGDDR